MGELDRDESLVASISTGSFIRFTDVLVWRAIIRNYKKNALESDE